MNRIDIFEEKYIDILAPNGIEFIWGVYMHLGMNDNEASIPQNKKIVLKVMENLMNNSVLIVKEWYTKPELNSKNLTVRETIDNIDLIWNEKTKYPDLYSLVSFASPKWYVDKTRELGLTMTTNWITFVKDKIGDLEKWIEENRPRE